MFIDATLYGEVDMDHHNEDVEITLDVMEFAAKDRGPHIGGLLLLELGKVAKDEFGTPPNYDGVIVDLEITIKGEEFDICGEGMPGVNRLLEALLQAKSAGKDEDEMIGYLTWLGDAVPDEGQVGIQVPNYGEFDGMYDGLDDFMAQAEIMLPAGCRVEDEPAFLSWHGYDSEDSPNGNLLIWREAE